MVGAAAGACPPAGDGMPDAPPDPIRCALERYERPLLHYAARLIGDGERARDVVQETFLRLCSQDLEALDGRLAEWLYTVCRNLALDHRKKDRPMTLTSDAQVLGGPSPEAGPGAAAEERDSVRAVLRVLAALPPNQQEVLRLKFQHDLSYKEIARITELSVSNVGYLMHVGLKTLRERLAGAEESDGRTARGLGGAVQ